LTFPRRCHNFRVRSEQSELVLEPQIGIACGRCDAWNPMGVPSCSACQNLLTLFGEVETPMVAAEPARATAVSGGALQAPKGRGEAVPEAQAEEPMEQARSYVCKSCHSQVPSGHKFCGRCGTSLPADAGVAKTQYFGPMQTPGKAKLILIRGERMDGVSYHLNSTEHMAGREQGAILFKDDFTLSPTHANFLYRDGKLIVKDEASLNGVYVRVKGGLTVDPGDMFMAGQQFFRLEATPKATDNPDTDGTYFYSSPKRPSPFRIVQVLKGGGAGMTYCARENAIQVGREGSDMNFATDPYMSSRHVRVEMGAGGKFSLADLGSKNGTYVRVKNERELTHGDYLFMGRKLLRVEITA